MLHRLSGTACAWLFAGAIARAQTPTPKPPAKFFEPVEPLAVTLVTNIKQIRGDKDDKAPWRAAAFTYKDDNGSDLTVPARIRTRGIWRLKTCTFPPLRVNFKNEDTKHTVFKGIDKPKLVNYCRNSDDYEQYVLQEFQLYRIYHLLTPASHAVRLMRITYQDSASGKIDATRYGFLEEDPDALAERLDGKMLEVTGARPADLEPYQDAVVGVFQYLIGNTDFALAALHNAELLARNDGQYLPIVYDFDFAGAVNAGYASPDPRLHIRNVRQRVYRGYCVPNEEYPRVFALFNAKKDAIYALYHDAVGKLLRPKVIDETLAYFDEFYKTINDPSSAKYRIIDACIGKE